MKNLIAIQQELKAPKDKYNSFGKYSYRSAEGIMEAVKPLLAKYGCVVTLSDGVEVRDGWHYVRAVATFRDKDWTCQVEAYAREEETKKGMDASQITGTASSYARKYALNGLFLIDDNKDADTDEFHEVTASEPKQAKAKKEQKAPRIEDPEPHPEIKEKSSLIVKRAHLRSLMDPETWDDLIKRQGEPTTWTEEQIDRWTKKLEEKNA